MIQDLQIIENVLAMETIAPSDWPDVEEWLIKIDAQKIQEGVYLANRFMYVREPLLEVLEAQSERGH